MVQEESNLVVADNSGAKRVEMIMPVGGSTAKIARLRRILEERGLGYLDIEVDGGIKVENVAEVAAAGATVLVIGSAIFNHFASVAANMAALREAVSRG